jgi:glutathione synthase/RimK-type ligase-like ATP-grasp enzyme
MHHMIDITSRLPVLLRGPAHETTLVPASYDFQTRVGCPSMRDEDGCTPCVVVLSRTADREMDELSLRLAADGIPMLRMDSDRLQGQDLCWDVERDVLVAGDRSFSPRACWVRYFAPSAIPVVSDARLAAYMRDQWPSWAYVLLAARGAHAVNAATGRGTPDRIEQLAQARSAGFRTPATVVATSLAAAARRIPGDGDLLVKSLGEHFVEPAPGRLTGLAPRRVGRRESMSSDVLEPAPVIVQEFLHCERELRIYVVGGEFITFAVHRPSPEALWTEPDRLRGSVARTPDALARGLRRLVAHWGLDVAAFDFLETPGGLVFLEVNVACDWLWCESLAGASPVSAAVHKFVWGHFDTRHAVISGRDPR